MPKGKLVILEGVDGSGKSTVARALHQYLILEGIDTIHIGTSTSSMAYSDISDFVRTNILSGKSNFSAETQGLVFCAILNDLIDTHILPSIDKGVWVICERFTLSTRIYQANSPITALTINMLETKVVPDLTIVLDIPPQVYSDRALEANKMDYFEKRPIEEIAERRRRYRQHARTKKHSHVLDGTEPVDTIVASIVELLKKTPTR